MQFGNFVFVEIQEKNFRGNLLGSKCDGDYHHNIISLVNNMQLYYLQICYENRIKIFFLEVPQRIERLQQNSLVKLRFSDSDSEQAQSFLLKLKTITTYFEHDIFHNNLKDNIKDKYILTNIAGCYQNRNSSHTFLWG